ncbi:IspD/TarI family cytidylyltransferase [Lipingzhangella sp. LS1_29]|uniref:2-C-methyl-D-erythritol 4-phosphate cytidylyltransferase n=1 Tax=Lipingzhangella rawalii TaxID=2055835 RepID=A0ABU2H368_9ACTN|nr:IspD/TarI family cytidylyltransferase [Lipingzhangella rawalii]MDS1269741.1 IspD/TarI family cytidylyltransferase [Lipingzhangella rawalii]
MTGWDDNTRPQVTAAVLAGGRGSRMGAQRPKQLLELAGRTILEHSLATFCSSPDVDHVLVLSASSHIDETKRVVAHLADPKITAVLPGGAERSDTSRCAIQALADRPDSDLLLLHDAARPLVEPAEIAACVSAATATGAASVAIPTSDTIVEAAPGPASTVPETVAHMPSRSGLRRMQTPQGFRLGTLRRAHDRAQADPHFQPTDDCGVVLRYLPETSVALVAGTEHNIKITHPGDIAIAAALLGRRTNQEETT